MDQTIIAMAGRKQSGKDTSYSCIRLWRPEAQKFSFADALKRVCVDVLGLEEWQAYGTDDQKNTLVPHLLWENFPIAAWDRDGGGVYVGQPDGVRWKIAESSAEFQIVGDGIAIKSDQGQFVQPVKSPDFDQIWTDCIQFTPTYNPDEAWHNATRLLRKRGPMTAREVLQYWGTEIFRRQYPQVWAEACIRKIRKSGCQLAVITDCRFPNEVEAVQNAGGKVIKLTKVVFPDDRHPSETALDPDVFDQDKFDAILDNAEMSVNEQCEALYGVMRRWGIVANKTVQRMHV